MIIASVIGSALVYQLIVDYISGQLGEYENYVRIFLAICIYIALGGGISVIVGAIIATKTLGLGKWIIGLGAGMGLLGFIIFIVTGIYAGTLTGTVVEIIIGLLLGPASYGIIGVFLTIFARKGMKKDKKDKKEEE